MLQGMDFSRVQASGVSNILLRGQTYTAPPNMKSMVTPPPPPLSLQTPPHMLSASKLAFPLSQL